MPPPLLLLQDIRLSFGSSPVLAGAGLAVGAGDRVCLVGRNGSGKSTLLRIAAGLMQPDAGRRFAQPGATIRYLPQEPDLAGFATTLAYVEAGLVGAAEEDRTGRATCWSSLVSPARRRPHACRAARRAVPRWPACWRRRRTFCCSTSRPTISTCRHRVAGERTGRHALRHRADQPRPAPAGAPLARHRLARPRRHPHAGPRFCRVRGLARRGAGAGGARAHKLGRKIAMEEDWLRYGVTARRKRNQKRLADLHALRKRRKEQRGGHRHGAAGAARGGAVRAAGRSWRRGWRRRIGTGRWCATSRRASCAATASASSGRNGAGKTTLLNLLTGALAPEAARCGLAPTWRGDAGPAAGRRSIRRRPSPRR